MTCASAAGTAALCSSGSPLGRGKRAKEKARRGARRMRVRLLQHMDVLSANLRSVLAQSPGMDPRRPRPRGCRFLWLLSLGQARESNRPPWMADVPHTDVSRLSRHGVQTTDAMTKSKWIPAFAGMTERWIPVSAEMAKPKRTKKKATTRVPILVVAEGFALRCCDTSARWRASAVCADAISTRVAGKSGACDGNCALSARAQRVRRASG